MTHRRRILDPVAVVDGLHSGDRTLRHDAVMRSKCQRLRDVLMYARRHRTLGPLVWVR